MDLLLGIFIALAVGGFYFISKDSRKIKVVFTMLALKHNGIVRKVFASYPRLELDYDGRTLAVSVTHGTNGPFTHLTYCITHWTGISEFIIVSRDMPTKVMTAHKDLQIHKTRDDLFDSKFISRCHDAGTITSLLSPELKKLLLELNDGNSTEVRFLKGREPQNMYRFELHVERVLTDFREYEKLIRTAVQILERHGALAA